MGTVQPFQFSEASRSHVPRHRRSGRLIVHQWTPLGRADGVRSGVRGGEVRVVVKELQHVRTRL